MCGLTKPDLSLKQHSATRSVRERHDRCVLVPGMTAQVMEAIQTMIRKDAQVEGYFYVALTINEMLLKQARVGVMKIDAKNYHPDQDERQLSG